MKKQALLTIKGTFDPTTGRFSGKHIWQRDEQLKSSGESNWVHTKYMDLITNFIDEAIKDNANLRIDIVLDDEV